MYKNIKYLFIFVIFFSFFKLNVNAVVVASGNCIYNFHSESFGAGAAMSIRISQNSNNELSYYYSLDELTNANDSNWKLEKSAVDNYHMKVDKNGSFLDEDSKVSFKDKLSSKGYRYKSCPKYAYLNINKNLMGIVDYDVYFSDESTVELMTKHNLQASVNSSPSINYNYSSGESGEGRKCSSEINWLKEPNDTSNNGGSCLYAGDSSDGCYVVQINYKLDELNGNSFDIISNFENWDSFKSYTFYYEEGFKKMFYETGCQGTIGVGHGLRSHDAIGHPQPVNSIMYSYSLHSGIKDSNNNFYNNFVHLNEVKSTDINVDVSIINSGTIVKYENCEEILGDDLVSMLKSVLGISRITVPILLNVFGVIDFGSAIFASDEEKMKKAQKKFINRLIIGIVIFMISPMLKLILSIAHNIWPVVDGSLCGIL